MNTQLMLRLRAAVCRASGIGIALLMFLLPTAHAADLLYSDTPLFWATGVQPNVALVIDTSGSMGGNDTDAVYPYTSVCDGSTVDDSSPVTFNAASSGTTPVDITALYKKITKTGHGFQTGDAVGYSSTGPIGGLTSGGKYYVARLSSSTFRLATSAANAISCAAAADGTTAVTTYCVNLTSRGTSGVQQKFTHSITRLDAAKEAACQTAKDNATSMHIGLYRFTGGTDGLSVQPFGSSASTLNSSLMGFSASGNTPLSSSLHLVLSDYAGSNSPIQYRCQKNYTVFFTDGAPTSGIDRDSSITYPTLGTSQSSTWVNSTSASGTSSGTPSWDGFIDPIYHPDSQDVYPWLDDLAQFGYDVDLKNGSAAIPTTCPTGTTTPTAGKDCGGKDWDGVDDTPSNATTYKKQNMVTFMLGFGPGANSELMRDTPLVNQNDITPAMVNTTNDTITLTGHGLKTGDYVHYYKSYQSAVITASASAASDILTGDTTGMTTGASLDYSNAGGATLQYDVAGSYTPTCGDIGGLNDGNTYYITSTTANTFTLSNSLGGSTIDLTDTGVTGTLHGFSRAAIGASTKTTATLSTSSFSTNPVNQTTETITINSHGFNTTDAVVYTCSSGTATNCIGGLTAGATYYIARTGTNTFKLASSSDDAVTCAASSTNCIDISRPTTATTTTKATFARASVAADSISVTAAAGATPVDITTETITEAAHGFSKNNRVTYTCTNGSPVTTHTDTASTSYYAVLISSGNPGTFKLALSAADAATTPTPITVDITQAGNASQTFTYKTAKTTIGGLYAYETDAEPDATPAPASESAAKGKYYVEVVDVDKIKLEQCGNFAGCTAGTGTPVDITSTGYGVLSTGPGKSYFAATAAELSSSLKTAFTTIKSETLSQAALSANTSQLGAGARVYQANFNTGDWSGDVLTYSLDTVTGVVSTVADWKASTLVPSAGSRNILTWNGSAGIAFPSGGTTGLTGTQLTSVNSDGKVVDWVRGKDDATLAGSRSRSNGVYGDILNGSPVYVGDKPTGNYDTTLPSSASAEKLAYSAFKLVSRTAMLYVGANDGMLHGLDATTGAEKVAFIPKGVYTDWTDANDNGLMDSGTETTGSIKKFYELTQTNYGQITAQPHRYFVDGKPVSGDAYFTTTKAGIAANNWHTVVVGGLGRGGRTVYAFDVTKTASFGTSNILWEFDDGGSGRMGYTYSRPVIARLQTGQWAAIFGNGYDGASDFGRLFIVNIEDGTLIKRIDTTGTGGLSSVAVYTDSNTANTTYGGATAVYAGDLKGNVWKFDISSTSTASWSPSIFFTATDIMGTAQPITSPIRLGSNATAGSGVMLYFGTGTYFQNTDKNYSGTPKNDTLYGLWDNGTSVVKTDLRQQSISSTPPYRTVTSLTVPYTGTGAGSRGWYINLVVGTNYEGERIVDQPLLAGNVLFATTVVPTNSDPCTGGGTSWIYGINALTGGLATIFDIDGDGTYETTISGVQSADGVYSEAIFISNGTGDGKGKVVTSTSGGTIDQKDVDTCPGCTTPGPSPTTPLQGGRMSWRQLQ